jgi:hypothetical protein
LKESEVKGEEKAMQWFYFIKLIKTQKCIIIIIIIIIIIDYGDGDDNNIEDDDDDDKGEYMHVRFKFEKIKAIRQNVQGTYLHIEPQG